MASIVRCRLELEEIGVGVLASILQSIAEDESGWITYELATGTTDQAMPISTSTGIATIDVLYITSDQTISWRVAAADTALTLDANGHHLLLGTNLTAVLVSNSSGSTANIRLWVGGT